MKILILAIFLVLHTSVIEAADCPQAKDPKFTNSIGLLPIAKNQLSSLPNTSLTIPFFLPLAADVTMTFYSADNDAVRTLSTGKLPKGEHELSWDGMDDEGLPVPDEAYTPVLRALVNGQTIIDDPREYSGGEIIPNLNQSWYWSGQSNITLNAPAPLRLLVRAVIDGGPLVKNISRWQAKPAGKVVERWDGFDQNRLVKVTKRDDLSVLVMGYCLPLHSIITYGANPENTYLNYREKKGFPKNKTNLNNVILHRNGRRLEKDYFLPRVSLPQIELSLPNDIKQNSHGELVINKTTQLKVNIPQKQRWLIEASLYEVSFFHDFQFIQEEEQGFLPIYWQINPKQFTKGRHYITVQISAFNGIFVSKTVAINVS